MLNFVKINFFLRQFLLIFFSFLAFSGFSQIADEKLMVNVIHNFKDEWVSYDQDLRLFVPYVKNNDNADRPLGLRVNLLDYPNAQLEISSKSGESYIFFNKKLKAKIIGQKNLTFSVNSLLKEINGPNLNLFFYGKLPPENFEVKVTYRTNNIVNNQIVQNKSVLNIYPRNIRSFQTTLTLVFMIFLGFTSFLGANFSKAYLNVFNFNNLFSGQKGSFQSNAKPLDRPHILFVILLSILVSFGVLLISNSADLRLFSYFGFFEKWSNQLKFLLNFLILLISVITIYISKYFLLRIIGTLFSLGKVIDIHYFKLIQTSIILFALAVMILLINFNFPFLPEPLFFKNTIIFIFSLFFIIRTLIIFQAINRIESFKILYLLSYLCIVEILPLVIGLRLFI